MEQARDGELVIELQQGNLEALGTLYDRHRQLVFRTALAITADDEAAADLLQDVFLRLKRFAEHIDPTRPLEPWLYRVTTNLAYTWIKRRYVWMRAWKEMAEWLVRERRPSPHYVAEMDDACHHVREAVSSLPPQQRIVVVLYYLNDLSLQEISEIVSVPVGTVKSRLYYGRRALRAQLGLQGDFVPEAGYEYA